MANNYSDTIFANMASANVTAATTAVALAADTSIYKLVFDSTDTEISFDTSALTVGEGDVISFELVLSVGATVPEIDFGEEISWYDEIAPTLSAASKDYTLQFRSFDGGSTWVGGNQTSENNGRT